MPQILSWQLRAAADGWIPDGYGTALHGLFFFILNQRSPKTASLLHDIEIRPVSLYCVDMRGGLRVHRGDVLSATIGLVDDAVGHILHGCFIEPFTGRLGSVPIISIGISVKRKISIDALIGEARNIGLRHSFTVRFLTPTAFKHGGGLYALPTSNLLLGGLTRKLSLYFPDEDFHRMSAALYDKIVPVECSLQSSPLPIGARRSSGSTGIVGYCRYNSSLHSDDPLRLHLNVLLALLPYAGAGYKPAMGMGGVEIVFQ